MSFLDKLVSKGKAKFDEYQAQHSSSSIAPPPQQQNYQWQSNQQYQQPYQYAPQQRAKYNLAQLQGPPPINYGSKPGGPPAATHGSEPAGYGRQPAVYWKANFNPQTPIYELFNQETGAHGWGNNESQNYTKDAANCFMTADNKLVLRGHVDTSKPENKYTSARLVSAQSLARQNGCITAVLTPPSATGIWPAFWLLPMDPCNWPTDGEVDIMESWNGDNINHSCLHWGNYNGEDWNKHRVLDTPVPSLPHQPHTFSFAWDDMRSEGDWEGQDGRRGRMVWYLDGKVLMKAEVPKGTRPMRDYRIILNIAMGGNVCQVGLKFLIPPFCTNRDC